jgi:hypothetical protein
MRGRIYFAKSQSGRFPYGEKFLFARKLRKWTKSQTAYSLLTRVQDCFCTNETWAWLTKGGRQMLWTIFVILLVLWLLGLVSGYAIGGFIHILLVIALVVLLINIIGGRRTVV